MCMHIKKICFLPCFIYSNSAFSQSGQWTWMNGADTVNSPGVFGAKGISSPTNTPPGLYEACNWLDTNGNFWIFGGLDGTQVERNDLWKYDPVAHEWTWMKGSGNAGSLATYGVQGVPSLSNNPGGRAWGVCSFVDNNNNLWMYGGIGFDASGGHSCFHDLWKYDINANEWTWMQGSDSETIAAVFGTKGIADPANTPGSRSECAASWTDKNNNLWLFGGAMSIPDSSHGTNLKGSANDLWKYNIGTNTWTWMNGDSTLDQPGIYGVKGVADANNVPGGRATYTKWIDAAGDFWMFGGYDFFIGAYNDVWKYHIATNMWTWMSGTNLMDDTGTANGKCNSNVSNVPAARYENRASAIDACGNFWTMGGFFYGNGSNSRTYNDLWKFDPVSLQWIWVSGDNNGNSIPFYGTQGVSSPLNLPDEKAGAGGWMDKSGNFWLFGGHNNLNFFAKGMWNDMWRYVPDSSCSGGTCIVLLPVANFQSSDSTFCSSQCINYTDFSTNATSWQWSFPGGTPSSSTIQNPQGICYDSAGTFDSRLIAFNSVGGSDTLTFINHIKVFVTPPTPVITQHHDTLFCQTNPTYTSYQWYDSTTLIPGATDTFLVVTHGGNYNVAVTNEFGCKISVGITIPNNVGINEFSAANYISLFPNPASTQLTIHPVGWSSNGVNTSSSRISRTATVSIMNVLGQEASPHASLQWKGQDAVIDISKLPAAMYFLQMKTENGSVVNRFVKE